MFYVTSTDPRRRDYWQRVFGLDRLPVLSPKPRWQVGRGEFRETEILAYDLDTNRLHWMAAARAATRLGIETRDLAGLPIRAGADIEVTAVSSSPTTMTRPFAFMGAAA